jgi:hypothetical protein
MTEDDVRLALTIFADAIRDGELDMARAIEDDALWERNRDRMSPDVKVRFVNPEEGGVQVMDQDYEGIEGLRQGWRTWLAPWDRYRILIEEALDAGDGQVLLLVRSVAHMRDSEVEMPQEAAALARIEDGRAVEISFYLDQAQARRDAGLS